MGCSSQGEKSVLRIGVDPGWYPIDFGPQQSFVNGFIEDILLEMAQYNGISFQKVNGNWDNLLEGIGRGKYDAVLTTLPRYSFHLAKYDFSRDCLSLGPVLIVRMGSSQVSLKDMTGEMVGVVSGDPAGLILLAYPEVIMREYSSIPELLNAVAQGALQGALLNQVPAVTYVSDLYSEQLQVVSPPLNEEGIHLITAKGKHERLIEMFDNTLTFLQKKKKLDPLFKKWNLN
jgi:ABC-type amino acid transport substrate-binding protein